jgi:hypothetical protein
MVVTLKITCRFQINFQKWLVDLVMAMRGIRYDIEERGKQIF